MEITDTTACYWLVDYTNQNLFERQRKTNNQLSIKSWLILCYYTSAYENASSRYISHFPLWYYHPFTSPFLYYTESVET